MAEILPLHTRAEAVHDAGFYFNHEAIEAEAAALIEAHGSLPQPEVLAQERLDNARTALMEALSASGHLSVVELTGDIATVNRQVVSRLLNGMAQVTHPHERRRRYAELCNELYIQKVFRAITEGQLSADTTVLEVSDYPSHLRDAEAQQLGYRAQNHKGMIRSTRLEWTPEGYRRMIEQVSRSHSDDGSSEVFLAAAGLTIDQSVPADLAVLRKPLLYRGRDYRDTVIDIQRRLDAYAGPGLRYGELAGVNSQHVAYESLRAESARRELQINEYSQKLADFEASLNDMNLTTDQHNGLYGRQMLEILKAICTLDSDYAADCFGAEAAGHFRQAGLYAATGQYDLAAHELEEAEAVAQVVVICGVALNSKEAKEAGIESAEGLIETGKESWQWKSGVCQVKRCPSPKPTEVGPCSVCRKCQRVFDKGGDPTKSSLAQAAGRQTVKAV